MVVAGDNVGHIAVAGFIAGGKVYSCNIANAGRTVEGRVHRVVGTVAQPDQRRSVERWRACIDLNGTARGIGTEQRPLRPLQYVHALNADEIVITRARRRHIVTVNVSRDVLGQTRKRHDGTDAANGRQHESAGIVDTQCRDCLRQVENLFDTGRGQLLGADGRN